MSDDITFCMNTCANIECFRHPNNIVDRTIPHSFSFWKDTEVCPLNNKKLGTAFEREMVDLLAKEGYWVHFITPDNRGAQPFDIIAVKDGKAMAIDCKTCKDKIFRMSRLEDNQIMAFEFWMQCGNESPYLAVEHKDKIIMIDYTELREKGKIDLEK